MKKFASVAILLIACFLGGYSLIRSNTNELSPNRDPAAVRNGFDFSNLRGEKLEQAIKNRLLSGLEFRKIEGGAGLGLGHFLFSDQNGEKKAACQEFQKVSFTFEAEGISVGGDKPMMEVEGRCEFSTDLSKINPLNVPVAKIVGEHPGDGEFQFNDRSPVTVRFTNLPTEWPRMWILKSVKLLNEKDARALVVESDAVAEILGRPMVFAW